MRRAEIIRNAPVTSPQIAECSLGYKLKAVLHLGVPCAISRASPGHSMEAMPKASTEPPEIYAIGHTRDLLIEALDARRIELGLTLEDLEYFAGMSRGSGAKYFGPSRPKNLGADSLINWASGVGLSVVFLVDPKLTRDIVERRRPRSSNQARQGHYARLGAQTINRTLHHMARSYSWPEILRAIAQARAEVAAQTAARTTADVQRPSKMTASDVASDGGTTAPRARTRSVSTQDRSAIRRAQAAYLTRVKNAAAASPGPQ
jgi:transcriptional regulator with XRE-family HTH domain